MEYLEGARCESTSYDQFFQENYGTLQRWALQITSFDRELSEDLLHDVYLRFSQKREQPADVESVHGYLYVALKNSYVTYLRKKTRMGSQQLSLLDFESADNATLIVDPRSTLRVHDDLRAICEYACERKYKSIAASILILRFFHGYFSAEVARVVNRSRNAVEARLMKARREASEHLNGHLNAEPPKSQRKLPSKEWIKGRSDLLIELRERVFAAKDGWCPPPEVFLKLYRNKNEGLSREDLSHIVSCRECLDCANDLLRMPRLAERHPLDTLGPQTTVEAMQIGRSRAAYA